jgi:anti-sigma regulatory factor (Ser/Thr protein kinase)
MITHSVVAVHESSQTFAARAEARNAAERCGMDETDAHRVGLVATELATNLVKHASGGGELLIRFRDRPAAEVELIALDRGVGIRDIAAALSDGHSSAGSPGTGLGAVRRLSEDFDISSTPGQGTAVLARMRGKRSPRAQSGAFDIAVISQAKPGELICGDAWFVRQYQKSAALLVADGLGHGVFASEASEAAVQAYAREPVGGETSRALESIHHAIRHTRGAAAAIADVSKERRTVRFSGIGNIVGAVCLEDTFRQTVSNNGTLGHQAQHFREYSYPWASDGVLILHSDGLSGRWTLDRYPGLRQRDPALIAAILYRDYSRSRDDATVLVAREAA